LQLSAQKWGAFNVRGDEGFRRTCAELAAEHGFNITNPELQQAIAAERERIRATREPQRQREVSTPASAELGVQSQRGPRRQLEQERRPGGPVREAKTLVEVYGRHLADVERDQKSQHADPSRLDALVAVRMRVTGHRREAIASAISEGAAGRRPDEKRDWETYGRRAAEFAFSFPGERLDKQLMPQREQFVRIEGRAHDRDLMPPGGPGGIGR
jgi:hypothetical protein